jgi:hypothetical protein
LSALIMSAGMSAGTGREISSIDPPQQSTRPALILKLLAKSIHSSNGA